MDPETTTTLGMAAIAFIFLVIGFSLGCVSGKNWEKRRVLEILRTVSKPFICQQPFEIAVEKIIDPPKKPD